MKKKVNNKPKKTSAKPKKKTNTKKRMSKVEKSNELNNKVFHEISANSGNLTPKANARALKILKNKQVRILKRQGKGPLTTKTVDRKAIVRGKKEEDKIPAQIKNLSDIPPISKGDMIHGVGPAKDVVITPIEPSWDNVSLYEVEDYEEAELVASWKPQMQIAIYDSKKFEPMEAFTANKKISRGWVPTFFVNPYQSLDYLAFEMVLKNTFVGALNDALTKFIMGTGFRPELELTNPDKDNPEKNENEIRAHQDIIDRLISIDHQLEYDDDDHIDVPFIEKISMLINHMTGFNRGALVFGYDGKKPIEITDKDGNIETYPEIPTSIKVAHPKELSIIKVDPETWRLEGVTWQLAPEGMVAAEDMIYLWNPITSAKYHNSYLYGGSLIMPMIDSARILRQVVGTDFPAIAKASWANPSVLVVKPMGQAKGAKMREYQHVASNIKSGAPNILLEDPNNVAFHSIDYNPRISELQGLCEYLIKYCVSCMGLPHSLFFDESASNRACYSEDTLTLTENGWKLYDEIDWYREKIATYNPDNGRIEYHVPDALAIYPYKGDMIHIKTDDQDVLVTPDHDMWVTDNPNTGIWKKVKAETLLKTKQFYFIGLDNQNKPLPDGENVYYIPDHIKKITNENVKRVPYEGNVYCFGVKNHLYVTSRNGTVTVQGNTMLGKIQLAISTVINPLRETIGRQISAQWYQRWFRLMYREKEPEIYKKFRIKMVFDDLAVEEWFDKIEAALRLNERKPLKDGAFGDIIGIDNYENKIDMQEMQKREQQQQMQGMMGGGPPMPGGKGGGGPPMPGGGGKPGGGNNKQVPDQMGNQMKNAIGMGTNSGAGRGSLGKGANAMGIGGDAGGSKLGNKQKGLGDPGS